MLRFTDFAGCSNRAEVIRAAGFVFKTGFFRLRIVAMGAGVNTLAFMGGDSGNHIDISVLVVTVDVKADD